MKANNYRLGNLVHTKNGIAKVVQLGSLTNPGYVGCKNIKTNYFENSCIPIPITPEWLEKFNFEKEVESIDDFDSVDYSTEIEAFVIRCQWNTYGTLYYIYVEGVDIKIQYVHEYQNLFFTLTQKELEL